MGLLGGLIPQPNRLVVTPPAPYDSGPTLSGHTDIRSVDPLTIDAVCRAMNAALPEHLQATPLKPGQVYRECYDPWNDVGYVPAMPSAAETEGLRKHMLGHARGGTHAAGNGEGPWWDASWKQFYGAPTPSAK